jgi:hypothetical protein
MALVTEEFVNEQLASPVEKPPPSVWKRLFVGSGIFVLVVVVLAAVQHAIQRSRDNNAIEKIVAELDETEPGWRLEEIDKARPEIPDAQNSALVVLAAGRLLPAKILQSKAASLLSKATTPELFDTRELSLLERELTAARAGLIEARKLADMPSGQFPLEYYYDSSARERRVVAAVQVRTALQLDALYLAQVGKNREALRTCCAIFNVARSFDDEPLPRVDRCYHVRSAAVAVERTLALSVPALHDLASLQAIAEDEETHPGLLLSQRRNRAVAHSRLLAMISGKIHVEDVYSDKDPDVGWRVKYAKWTIRDGIRRGSPQLLELHNRAVEVARLPLYEQAAAEKALEGEIVSLARSSPYFKSSCPDAWFVGQEFRGKVALLRCLAVLLALERYRQERGTWPANLEELTPKLLKAVPLDPYDGKPLRFKKLADGAVVYSVGPDCIDNGGTLADHRILATPGKDLGFRLWDVKYCRRPPPPRMGR